MAELKMPFEVLRQKIVDMLQIYLIWHKDENTDDSVRKGADKIIEILFAQKDFSGNSTTDVNSGELWFNQQTSRSELIYQDKFYSLDDKVLGLLYLVAGQGGGYLFSALCGELPPEESFFSGLTESGIEKIARKATMLSKYELCLYVQVINFNIARGRCHFPDVVSFTKEEVDGWLSPKSTDEVTESDVWLCREIKSSIYLDDSVSPCDSCQMLCRKPIGDLQARDEDFLQKVIDSLLEKGVLVGGENVNADGQVQYMYHFKR